MSVLSACTSSLTPTATFSRTRLTNPPRPLPDPLPLAPLPPALAGVSGFPFFPFSSAMIPSGFQLIFFSQKAVAPSDGARPLHSLQERAGIIEVSGLSFGPLVEPRNIHQDLPVRREFHVRPVHRPRRRAFEVDSFTVVTTAMTRALEFVFRGLPVGRAAQVGAAGVN